ncbi:adenosylcobinamide-phosphate synthase CbiB [Bisbaumannia pacifica]|uniref:Cobalamin biosynthesis protein CobD n=1 Tax=Bisbaumannia pacifica TaxID=77098 RepID=A0ABD4L2J9_9GAMM|nr:adenosylcobinamide-phosphate synthase CbiB [Halomonas pacifica]MBH8580952.1 cobalamin biosynthesis protein CobD [Halomonas pacifica]
MAEPLSLGLLGLVLLALVLDLIIGDPRALPHPVVGIGAVIARLERAWNRGSARARRLKGALMCVLVVLGTYALAWATLALLAAIHPGLAWLAELWLLASCLAIKGLRDAAREIAAPLARGELTEARRALAMVVGRDTAHLDEAEISRGAVETVAENTVDGITAPLFFALLGGAPLALAYKAINTLDSMVGYRDERYADFGWASARLDDVANWLPARLTALTLWLSALCLGGWDRTIAMGVAEGRWGQVGAKRLFQGRKSRAPREGFTASLWSTCPQGSPGPQGWKSSRCNHPSEGITPRGALAATWREAPRHPSPNSGWPEAMVANLLGVQLGGINTYRGRVSERARLGTPRRPLAAGHIAATLRLMHGGWLGFVLSMAAMILLKEAW